MTLQECIDRYHEAQAQPINARSTVVTPLGHALLAARRLREALELLSLDDRARILRPLFPQILEPFGTDTE